MEGQLNLFPEEHNSPVKVKKKREKSGINNIY